MVPEIAEDRRSRFFGTPSCMLHMIQESHWRLKHVEVFKLQVHTMGLLKLILGTDTILSTSCEIGLRWMPLRTPHKSTLLNCPVSSGVTRPQWVKRTAEAWDSSHRHTGVDPTGDYWFRVDTNYSDIAGFGLELTPVAYCTKEVNSSLAI